MILNIGLSLAPAAVMMIMGVLLLLLIQAQFPQPFAGIAAFLILGLGSLVWFLLLPNAAYLITELNLSHRKPNENVPLWYDIVLVITLALSGILNTLANIAVAQIMIAVLTDETEYGFTGSPVPWIGLAVTLLLVALGMYLGRYLRLNSWDLLHPSSMFRKVRDHFGTKGNIAAACGFVLIHALLLFILYLIVMLPSLTRLFAGATGG